MSDHNQWQKMVGHRDCEYPCSGKPVLKTKPGKVCVMADDMPAYLTCSECGCTPLPDIQPTIVARYLRYWLKQKKKNKNTVMPEMPRRKVGDMFIVDFADPCKDHFCIGRILEIGGSGTEYIEYWAEASNKWRTVGTIYVGRAGAKAKLKELKHQRKLDKARGVTHRH